MTHLRCSAKVSAPNGGWFSYQCTRKATVERGGKPYCTQHDPEKVKARQEASSERWHREQAEQAVRVEQAAVALLRAKGYTVTAPEVST